MSGLQTTGLALHPRLWIPANTNRKHLEGGVLAYTSFVFLTTVFKQ